MTIRWIAVVAGSLVLAFGLAALNYTKADGLEHHVEWAREKGMPQPGYGLFLVGAGATALGGVVVGWSLGSRRRGA